MTDIVLQPHALDQLDKTDKVLVVLPMEPQPDDDWTDEEVRDWFDGACPRCWGTGELEHFDPEYEEHKGVCDNCGGTGECDDGKPPYRVGDVLVPRETIGCIKCVTGHQDVCKRHKDARYTVTGVEAKRVGLVSERECENAGLRGESGIGSGTRRLEIWWIEQHPAHPFKKSYAWLVWLEKDNRTAGDG